MTQSAPQSASTSEAQPFGHIWLHIVPTGEIQVFPTAGIDVNVDIHGETFSDDWRESSLQAVLRLVPSLVNAVDGARMRGHCVEVKVNDGPEAVTT